MPRGRVCKTGHSFSGERSTTFQTRRTRRAEKDLPAVREDFPAVREDCPAQRLELSADKQESKNSTDPTLILCVLGTNKRYSRHEVPCRRRSPTPSRPRRGPTLRPRRWRKRSPPSSRPPGKGPAAACALPPTPTSGMCVWLQACMLSASKIEVRDTLKRVCAYVCGSMGSRMVARRVGESRRHSQPAKTNKSTSRVERKTRTK